MPFFQLQQDQHRRFEEDGFILVPGLLSEEETRLLGLITERVVHSDPHRLDRHDAEGRLTLLSLRNELCDDIFSTLVRCERVARTMEVLLGDEVYHYHHKVMIKEPEVGGAWEWHQDYGYWYENGCLRPDLASCMIAITASTKANGCLEVVPGSHRLGRIDHVEQHGQVCADPERVEKICARLGVRDLELGPGDGLFFHSNLLHRSQRNRSDDPRLSVINCFNTKSNDPIKEHHHPGYSPLDICPDDEVQSSGVRQWQSLSENME
jgi:hypothetical protein